MSKVLLIQSPYVFPDPAAHLSEPLGLEYLTASLHKAGHEVRVYDPTLMGPRPEANGLFYYGASTEEIADKIRAFSPDVVGISCHYAYSSQEAYSVAQTAKRVDDRIITIMGGLFVSTHQKKPLSECRDLDYCLVGEADATFPELLNHLSSSSDAPTGIDGLIWRENGQIKRTEKTKYIDDLDQLPFPARNKVDISTYMNGSKIKRLYGLGFKPSLSLLTSRSCPNRCSFCNMRLVHGNRWRARSADNVLDELDEMIGAFHAEHVFIMDDNFTLNVDRAKTICEKIIQRGLRFRWNTPNGISVRGMDAVLAKLMKRAGCANVCIAIESGSDYIRNEVMNKKTSDEQIIHASECFNAADVPVVGFVLLGMPGENEERFYETVSLLKRLPLTSVVVSFAVPFPGTKLYDDLIQQGILKQGYMAGTDDLNSPSFVTSDFTADDLKRRKKLIKDMFPGLEILYEIENRVCKK